MRECKLTRGYVVVWDICIITSAHWALARMGGWCIMIFCRPSHLIMPEKYRFAGIYRANTPGDPRFIMSCPVATFCFNHAISVLIRSNDSAIRTITWVGAPLGPCWQKFHNDSTILRGLKQVISARWQPLYHEYGFADTISDKIRNRDHPWWKELHIPNTTQCLLAQSKLINSSTNVKHFQYLPHWFTKLILHQSSIELYWLINVPTIQEYSRYVI